MKRGPVNGSPRKDNCVAGMAGVGQKCRLECGRFGCVAQAAQDCVTSHKFH
jgi:hypothetical protein